MIQIQITTEEAEAILETLLRQIKTKETKDKELSTDIEVVQQEALAFQAKASEKEEEERLCRLREEVEDSRVLYETLYQKVSQAILDITE